MADEQQLDLLLQGKDVWNAWRQQNPETHPDFRGANLSEANLEEINLEGTNLSEANFVKANLSGATLSRAILVKTDLSEATLSGAIIDEAILYGVNLRGANLRTTSIRRTNLNVADLNRADLTRAVLCETRLIGTNFSGANLRGANLWKSAIGWTIFGDVDLRTVEGLETVTHDAPSTIGADTILRSEGDIPEKFLRGAGLSDTFITYVRSLVQNPVEYYTCFISHSSKDHEFVQSLHADLEAKGVRCYYAPKDMKIGDKIRQRIDESIRQYDKLLLVLSEQSVKSAWVEYEVEAALAKERRESRTVLFPIHLDTAVMKSHTDWADHIRETRHIGDFTRWKGHDTYQRGLKKLLHDLQSTNPPTSKP